MIEWIAHQQLPLSMALLFLIAAEHLGTRKMGERFTYALWLLVPAVLVINNVPSQLVSLPATQISHFIVGLRPTVQTEQFNTLLWVWSLGAIAVLAVVTVRYLHIWLSVSTNNRGDRYPTAAVSSPMLFGFITPVILLPGYFSNLFSPAQQALIIEHEQTHQRHFDHLWNGMALLLIVLFWFNPLVWLGVRSFRISQEIACDSAVLRTKTANEKLLYAKALVQCAEHGCQHTTLYPTFGEKNTMLKRLHAIKQPVRSNKLLAAAALVITTAFVANTALANHAKPAIDSNKINLATPVKRVAPVYPQEAASNNQEGSVILQFDITENGSTDNIRIIDSFPDGVFDASATTALKQWQYKPRIQGGKAERQAGILVQLDFRLDEETAMKAGDQSEMEKIKISSGTK